jgi:hypothetical protein
LVQGQGELCIALHDGGYAGLLLFGGYTLLELFHGTLPDGLLSPRRNMILLAARMGGSSPCRGLIVMGILLKV